MKNSNKTAVRSGVPALNKKPVLKKQSSSGFFFIYILEMENGFFYTGYTVDMPSRYKKHCSGTGAKFTRAFKPVRIAACWTADAKGEAMKVEAFIKSLDRKEKMLLVMNPRLLKKMLFEKKGCDFSVDRLDRRTIKKISG